MPSTEIPQKAEIQRSQTPKTAGELGEHRAALQDTTTLHHKYTTPHSSTLQD
jgi:hypothetical protein